MVIALVIYFFICGLFNLLESLNSNSNTYMLGGLVNFAFLAGVLIWL